jgi:hypothetical protein
VLQYKPWHFEALHLKLLIAFRRVNTGEVEDDSILWKAARQTLPPLNDGTNHRRRRAWVARAVQQAQAALEQAEENLMVMTHPTSDEDDDHSMWQ